VPDHSQVRLIQMSVAILLVRTNNGRCSVLNVSPDRCHDILMSEVLKDKIELISVVAIVTNGGM
jgi:hypothetical protein